MGRVSSVIVVNVQTPNVRTFVADALACADEALVNRLRAELPIGAADAMGSFAWHDVFRRGLKVDHLLLERAARQPSYVNTRRFARDVLRDVDLMLPDARHVALTIHDAGYGLDEEECIKSALAGIIEALERSNIPSRLERVSLFEPVLARAQRFQRVLDVLLPDRHIPARDSTEYASLCANVRVTLQRFNRSCGPKPPAVAFVAMPYVPEMEDAFHYGIRNATKAAGMLCERADLSSFTGDVMKWVRERISTARFVIADLSTANANVYLEVGYAWGKGVPTILLCKDPSKDLLFDVRGHRCIVYASIKQLEQLLSSELQMLSPTAPAN